MLPLFPTKRIYGFRRTNHAHYGFTRLLLRLRIRRRRHRPGLLLLGGIEPMHLRHRARRESSLASKRPLPFATRSTLT
jgi:hypothetical protein